MILTASLLLTEAINVGYMLMIYILTFGPRSRFHLFLSLIFAAFYFEYICPLHGPGERGWGLQLKRVKYYGYMEIKNSERDILEPIPAIIKQTRDKNNRKERKWRACQCLDAEIGASY